MINKSFISHNNLGVVLLTIIIFILIPLLVNAADFQNCVDCHEETLAGDRQRFHLHSPFTLNQCQECHAAKVSESSPVELTVKTTSTVQDNRNKINWLEDSTVVATSHSFLLSGDKAGHTLVIEAHDTDGKLSHYEILVPKLAYLPEIIDNGKPPTISKVQVLKVERGVFLSVIIGWQTDTLTYALVRYSDNKDLSQSSETSTRLGLKHQVTLYKLKPDRLYNFTVVAQDLFGHIQVSEPLSFSTAKPLAETLPYSHDQLTENVDKALITSAFQRKGSDYLLELSLGQPAAVYIGSKGVVRGQALNDASNAAMGGDSEFHAGLSSEVVLSLHSCPNCHENQSTATHPVNVYPKPGMTIPQEYPTLADGRITCSSCHISHSSDYEYLARKRSKRELCVGCHKDML